MKTDDFYKNLSVFENLEDLSKNKNYRLLPDDWYVIVTDVKGSTKAIENKQYKDVNMVGALCIISVLNLDKSLDIPFVFGGDGAFLFIPPTLLESAKQALLAIQKISQNSYGLDLRIGAISLKDIYSNGKKIFITKLKISNDYSQAIIKGGGLEYSDKLLKSSERYYIKDKIDENFKVNLDGLECRWQHIPSHKDETLSILIKAKDDDFYEEVFKNLEKILGDSTKRHPIIKENLKLSYTDKNLNTEASIYAQTYFRKKLVLLKLKMINFLGDILMFFKVDKWGGYKDRILSTTDTEKFDDMLRMTVSSDHSQTMKLQSYLQKEYEDNNIFYGIHKAKSSLMTCLVFERHGKHIHFVDASDGGYAMAAKMFKKQLRLQE
jgi:hypothetical protein